MPFGPVCLKCNSLQAILRQPGHFLLTVLLGTHSAATKRSTVLVFLLPDLCPSRMAGTLCVPGTGTPPIRKLIKGMPA
jgi:hypothetical protein